MRWKKILSLGLLFVGTTCLSMTSEVSAKDYDRIKISNENFKRTFGDSKLQIDSTDPEMADTLKRYIYGDIAEQSKVLTDTEREVVRIASLATIGVKDTLKREIAGALNLGQQFTKFKQKI